MHGSQIAMLLLAGTAQPQPQPAGPPPTTPAQSSPAEQAMALYRINYGPRYLPPPCRTRPGEIVVCGQPDGRSQFRLPLPEERGAPDGPRLEAGGQSSAEVRPVRTGSCGTQDQGEHCTGGVGLLALGVKLVALGAAALHPEAARDRDDARLAAELRAARIVLPSEDARSRTRP